MQQSIVLIAQIWVGPSGKGQKMPGSDWYDHIMGFLWWDHILLWSLWYCDVIIFYCDVILSYSDVIISWYCILYNIIYHIYKIYNILCITKCIYIHILTQLWYDHFTIALIWSCHPMEPNARPRRRRPRICSLRRACARKN